MEFLTAILASIFRPIIQAEIEKLRVDLKNYFQLRAEISEITKTRDALKEQLAKAKTVEDYDKIIDQFKSFNLPLGL